MTRCVVVMGVAGSGKSTVGTALAQRLGWRFVDADDHHPSANVDKMRRGIPLDDDDRGPWLAALNDLLRTQQASGPAGAGAGGVVLACSALTRAYRERLTAGIEDVAVVHLRGSPELLATRLRSRPGHFMPADLLASQLATLEEPLADDALCLDAGRPVAALVQQIASSI